MNLEYYYLATPRNYIRHWTIEYRLKQKILDYSEAGKRLGNDKLNMLRPRYKN